MQSRFDFKSPLTLVGVGVILFIVFGGLWWKGVYQSPRYVFTAMLSNNLSTNFVTKNELTSSSGEGSLQQINLQLGSQNLARSLVTIKSDTGTATTESVGAKGVGYIRYVHIADAKTTKDYTPVTNVWAISKNSSDGANLTNLFSQVLIDITAAPMPPIGNVPSSTRADMLAYIKQEQVFTPDYSTASTKTINGRQAYVYNVDVKLAPYLRLMQEFAHVYGLKDLDKLSPSDFQSAKPVLLTVSVDKLSHQMVRVTSSTSGLNETYTDYGVEHKFQLPEKAISTTELRSRLSQLK